MFLRMLVLTLIVTLSDKALADNFESGPEKGSKVPALKVYDCTGENKEKTVDYAALRKDKITVYLLVAADKFDRPMNRFMRMLDEKANDKLKDVYLVAVMMTDDEPTLKERLPRVQMSVNYAITALCTLKGNDPKDWNVNADAHLTVVLASKGKVVERFAFKSVNDTDVPKVYKALEKLAKK